MKFGPVPLAEAEGAVLAHSLALSGGGRIRKGTVLDGQALARLAASGHDTVVAARLDHGDVAEDAAARAFADALMAPDGGLYAGPAATGRVNLFAEGAGVLGIDAAAVRAANGIDPAITVATLPRWQRVGPGDMVATIKIIPYAVPGAALARAAEAGRGALSLHPTRRRRVAMIETRIDGLSPGQKGRRATKTRLERLGAEMIAYRTVPHAVDAVAAALAETQADAVLILTASATSDAGDVAPMAVTVAGGAMTHFGMPVDPGNLLFIGALPGDIPVIGLPGCARTLALNGVDWVLERVLCDVAVSPEDIAAMGVGGLLKDVQTRGRPRAKAD